VELNLGGNQFSMVRFGIVGFGLHAVRRLMPGFALAQRCRVTALSSREIEKARESGAEYGIPQAFDSTAELCRSKEVDAVLVTTPNALHLKDVLTAIELGKPVLCEKPMAMNAGECRQMVEAARKANVLLGVAHVFRFEDSTARFRERIAGGQIGRPIFARAEFSYQGKQHRRTWLTDPALAGGGPIGDVGVHCVDAMRYILQDEIARVGARGMWDKESGGVEAAAVLALEFEHGTLGSVMVSMRADYRTPIEFVGDAGNLRADDGLTVDHPIMLELRRSGKLIETEEISNKLAYAHQVDAFADAVEGKAPFPVPAEQGWQNQEILDAAFRSLMSGKIEDVPRVV
jgi:1,5-anhydro-D-fructose reductase (1,5-anhydro-D-mannitol-forming)